MNGEALHRAPEATREAPYPTLLELFAAVLTGRAREHTLDGLTETVSKARSAARAATSRIPLGREETLALRLIYKETRATRDPSNAVVRGDAMSALQQIPRRQRATVLLSVAFDLPPDEVAVVIGVRPTAVEAILGAGLASLSRVQDTGIDAVRVLRMQARALVAQREADAESRPARLPRAVIRTLVAPALNESDTETTPTVDATSNADGAHGTKLSPVEVLLAPSPSQPLAPSRSQPEATPASRKRRMPAGEMLRKLALVAAIFAVVVAVLLPASARDKAAPAAPPQQPSATTTQRVAARPAATATTQIVVVRRGDSLWRIAERRLGNPLRWGEIWRLNRGLEMTQGRRFERPDLIHPGWRLKLPKR